MKNVVVLGSGLSGLGCARALPGARVFEAASHVGGHSFSHEVGGVHFDEGAHICHSRDPAWLDLVYAQAGDVVKFQQSLVSNYWHGHWITYPVQNHLRMLPVDVRIRCLSDLVAAQIEHRGREPANYLEWCEGQYGRFLTDRFYREYTGKYWRVPMEELGTDWLSGRLLPSQIERILAGAFSEQEEKQSVFSLFHYPARGGYFNFFRGLYGDVPVTLNARAVSIDVKKREVAFADGRRESFDLLVSTIPLPDLVAMIRQAPDDVKAAAARLRHTKLLVVNMVIRKPRLVPHHWFYVYDPDMEVARVKVISNVAPDSVPAGTTALQAEIFRRHDEPMDADRLVRGAVTDMGRILGFDPDRDVAAVRGIPVSHAYPISDLHRPSAVKRILDWLETQPVLSAGLFGRWQFIWSDAAYRSGEGAARAVRDRP